MFYVYDTKKDKSVARGFTIRCNAERIAQRMNIQQCGIDEVDKPEDKRRFVIKEV